MPPFKEPGDRKGRPYISQYLVGVRVRATARVAPTFRNLDSFEKSSVVCEEVADVVDAVLL